MPYSTISHCQVLTKHIRTARPIADDEFLRVREVCQFARWGCFTFFDGEYKDPTICCLIQVPREDHTTSGQ